MNLLKEEEHRLIPKDTMSKKWKKDKTTVLYSVTLSLSSKYAPDSCTVSQLDCTY